MEFKMNKNDMVLIEWYDARLFSGTYNDSAILEHKMALFKSVGYFISKDKITTKIASETNNEDEYRDIMLIPTGSIVSVKQLSVSAV
jgi:hypothetical protein